MTIKSLLFCLFLYVCLVWVGAAYLNTGPDIQHYGLLWTAIGLIAVLAFIIGARLFGWWRLWRAKAAARPAPAAKSVPAVHPDDEAMSALIAEANAALAKAPSLAGRREAASLSTMPLYLLIGPEGSGKTSTFLNSSYRAAVTRRAGNRSRLRHQALQFLAGQGCDLCRNRWSHVYRRTGPLESVTRGVAPAKSRFPSGAAFGANRNPGSDLRGVIAFCDSKELTGASSDPQRLERYSRDWQERLRAIADQFGAGLPVYVVITKCDKIPFFSDFFRRLPESEVNQVLGCTLPPPNSQAARSHRRLCRGRSQATYGVLSSALSCPRQAAPHSTGARTQFRPAAGSLRVSSRTQADSLAAGAVSHRRVPS